MVLWSKAEGEGQGGACGELGESLGFWGEKNMVLKVGAWQPPSLEYTPAGLLMCVKLDDCPSGQCFKIST